MENTCPVCGFNATRHSFGSECNLIECKCCGRFIASDVNGRILSESGNDYDINMLASFLYYNNVLNERSKTPFYYLPFCNSFDALKKQFPDLQMLKPEDIEAWYPKTFSQKIDKIMLALGKLSKFDGDNISLSRAASWSLLFIKRFDQDGIYFPETAKVIDAQEKHIVDFLKDQEFIDMNYTKKNSSPKRVEIVVLPKGSAKIDELQKYQTNSNQAFVAMSFSEEMEPVREAIRNAIIKAGYKPVLMDELKHNKQIIPTMFDTIQQSKFVIAEFTEHNNGAYYEAGYAEGLGKEVINVCEEDAFKSGAHFDIKQKNTVMWESYEDLENKLYDHIKATMN